MAILTDNDRETVWADMMRKLSTLRESLATITKAELRAAINAADQWASDNQASFKTSIPQPARSALTNSQLAGLLMDVVAKRFNKGV